MNYPGGKNGPGTYQTIINQIPPHRVYVEPFAGSAAIYWHKRLAKLSYLIEVDADIATALQAMVDVDQRRFGRQPRLTVRMPTPAPGDRDGNSTVTRSLIGAPAVEISISRSQNNLQLPDPNGAFTVNGRLPGLSRHSRLQVPAINGELAHGAGVVVICADATRWLRSYDWRGDEFVYADPPYLDLTRRSRRQIYRHEIQTEEAHAGMLDILTALPCPVMISGYWSELYSRRLAAWRLVRFQSMTRGGKQAAECLWMNYGEPLELHDYSYLGRNSRERQDLKRMRERWEAKLAAMPRLKRQALMAALQRIY